MAVQGSLPAGGTGTVQVLHPEQGQEKHPQHFFFFISRPGWAPHAHPCVCPTACVYLPWGNRAERKGSSSPTGCASPWSVWRSLAGIDGTLVCPTRTLGSSLLLPPWGNSLAVITQCWCEPPSRQPCGGTGLFWGLWEKHTLQGSCVLLKQF